MIYIAINSLYIITSGLESLCTQNITISQSELSKTKKLQISESKYFAILAVNLYQAESAILIC